MASNDLTFNQISSVLNSIVRQATGRDDIITPTNTSEFVTVAQMGLKCGYDQLYNAVSQVLARTIFSIRPYAAKFKGLQVSRQRFGAITRKLQVSDSDFQDDKAWQLEDGKSVDMYKFKKANVLQTNFYGGNVYAKQAPSITIHQLDQAFHNAVELHEFLELISGTVANEIEQSREVMSRATLANLIGGKYIADPDSCFHLISEYNAQTGLALTPTSIYDPANYKSFIQWVYARVNVISQMLTERTSKYQINIDNHVINRHTPLSRQKVFLYAPARYQIETMAIANTYHDTFMRMAYNETVNFWQNFNEPNKISVQPVYLQPTGSLAVGATTEIDNLFGVIFDEEAAGITQINEWSATTPFNANGGYSNTFYHYTLRYWNDFTEKCVLLLLD